MQAKLKYSGPAAVDVTLPELAPRTVRPGGFIRCRDAADERAVAAQVPARWTTTVFRAPVPPPEPPTSARAAAAALEAVRPRQALADLATELGATFSTRATRDEIVREVIEHVGPERAYEAAIEAVAPVARETPEERAALDAEAEAAARDVPAPGSE